MAIPGGRTKLLGVMGWPVAHSLSPHMQGIWLEQSGLDAVYLPLPVRPDDFSGILRAMGKMGFLGANVTIPHKETAFSLVDSLTEPARRAGSVNTLTFLEGGGIEGDTTDGAGFLAALDAAAPGWEKRVERAVILGAGGAARAILFALMERGITTLDLVNRNQRRAEKLAEEVYASRMRVFPWRARQETLEGAGLVVNATSLGMEGTKGLEIDLRDMHKKGLVFDMIYRPAATEFLQQANALGLVAISGIDMLIHQGRLSFKRWFGILPEIDAVLRASLLGRSGPST